MERYIGPKPSFTDRLRKIGSFFFKKPHPAGLSGLFAENSRRAARLVIDSTDPPRFLPSELPANAGEVLDAEFKKYWTIAVEGQARRAEENERRMSEPGEPVRWENLPPENDTQHPKVEWTDLPYDQRLERLMREIREMTPESELIERGQILFQSWRRQQLSIPPIPPGEGPHQENIADDTLEEQ